MQSQDVGVLNSLDALECYRIRLVPGVTELVVELEGVLASLAVTDQVHGGLTGRALMRDDLFHRNSSARKLDLRAHGQFTLHV